MWGKILGAIVGCLLSSLFVWPVGAAWTATLEWDPSPEPNVVGYKVHYGTVTRAYTSVVEVTAPSTTLILSNLESDQRYYFAVAVFDSDGFESPFSDEISALSIETPEDQATTIALNNGAGDQFAVVSSPLHGTLSGAVPNLTYTPIPDFYGGDRFDLVSTDAESNSIPFAVLLRILPVNDPPTLGPIPDVVVNQNSGAYTVNLSGITSGANNEAQTLTVTAVSSNRALLPDPVVNYTSANQEGFLTFTPSANVSGTALIVVTISDGQTENGTVACSFTVQVEGAAMTGVPAPWQTADIGSVGMAGNASASNGIYTVKGAGNISGMADNFRFVYQPLSGDGEIKARLNSVESTGASGRMGVMIRESLTSGSAYTFMGITSDGRFRWQRRSSTGRGTSSTASALGTPPNVWMRLVRTGSTIDGYRSSDGTTWTQVESLNITIATDIYFGFAVASGSSNTLDTATFSNLTVVP